MVLVVPGLQTVQENLIADPKFTGANAEYSPADLPARADITRSTELPLRGVLEPLQRLEDSCLSRHGGFTLLLFFLDDVFGRVGDKLFIR